MTLVDLLEIPRVGDPQITADGRRIAFTLATIDWTANTRVAQIWLVQSGGSGATPLTSIPGGIVPAPKAWSPDGETLAFTGRAGDSVQAFLLPAAGGEPRQLTRHTTSTTDLAWAPDGKSLYFLASEPPSDEQREAEKLRDVYAYDEDYQQQHLWRITLGGDEQRLTTGDYSVTSFSVGASGRIVLVRAPTPTTADAERRELWTMNADGSGARQLTRNSVEEGEGAASPDGSQVLFLARANGRLEPYYNANLFLVPAAGGDARAVLAEFPYEVLSAKWSATGRSIWMLVNMGVHSELFELDLATGRARQATSGEHAIPYPQWSLAGDHHAFLIDEPTRIGDVWRLDPGAASPVRVTGVYDYLDREFALPRQERVEWKGADGAAVEGILTYPVSYRAGTRVPLVVQLHGGPEDSDRFGWGQIFLNYQPAWAGRGYAVLRPNYRGSSGYGNAAYRDVIGGFFRNNYLDVLAGVDRVIAMGVADPDRLGVMGWSAGGHLVNKLITVTNRFKAASAGAAAANWISMYGQTDTRADRELWFGGTPWQQEAPIAAYWNNSPLKDVWKARTPTLFFTGERDPRVPLAQAIEMMRALRAQGVPTHLEVAPLAGHVWTRPRHQLAKMNLETAWFETYVRDLPFLPEKIPAGKAQKSPPAR